MAKVNYVRMHATTYVPGIGNVEPVLPPMGKSGPLEMEEGAHGVEVNFRGVAFTIPYAAIQIYTKEAKKASSSPKAVA